MKNAYAYIRISDKHKQGDGVSLIEQKRILEDYAAMNNIKIIQFYEERQTAAKRGRPIFKKMMDNLFQRKASALIIHKIDRGSRNLHDWADITELIDKGIEVHFAHENLNLDERGGRLSADIQAVMASDYIRNLKQEAKKGLYGRLRQGIYPFKAPLGYLDAGKGKVKEIDPIKAPLIKKLFELYIKEGFSIRELVKEMYKRGLRNTKGNKVTKNSIINILSNPFYYGTMRAKGELFEGKHEKLISYKTFKRAEAVRKGKTNTRVFKHDFLFRKMLTCKHCSYKLIGELQKGNVYYRCHTKACPTKSIRGDYIENTLKKLFSLMRIQEKELLGMKNYLDQIEGKAIKELKQLESSLIMRIGKLDTKLSNIRNLLIENILDHEEYKIEKEKTLAQKQELLEQKEACSSQNGSFLRKVDFFLELSKNLIGLYDSAILSEKRELIKILTSNLLIEGKKLMFPTLSPIYKVLGRDVLVKCTHSKTTALKPYSTISVCPKDQDIITPTSLSCDESKIFVDILIKEHTSLPHIFNHHEIQRNHPSSK